LVTGYNEAENSWYSDRTKAGKSNFNKGFAKRITAKRKTDAKNADMKLIIDAASVELFADKGLTVMTAIFFPKRPYDKLTINSRGLSISDLSYNGLKSIWH
jgi:fructan beta-fructosidase